MIRDTRIIHKFSGLRLYEVDNMILMQIFDNMHDIKFLARL